MCQVFKVLVNLHAITNGFYRKTCFYLSQFLFISRNILYSRENTRTYVSIANFYLTARLQVDDFSTLLFSLNNTMAVVVCAGYTEQVFTKHKEYLAITNILFNYCGIRYKRTFFLSLLKVLNRMA